MALAPGSSLGAYEVLALLGAGGMGEVYRARDVKLGREVALKILPDAFSADLERLARFRREAQLLAALNHPNIAGIYGFDEALGRQFLILELVEGATLAQRISAGPVPYGEALAIARQVIDALEAAHEKGIVHRDLKPANIALTIDGRVKVLDFGLAKAMESDVRPEVSNSPTLTIAATQAGVILGTAAYMSPEQAKGRAADKRSDVWAFGCVLFEMLTGKRAFEGEDVSDTLAAILRAEPDWTALPSEAPDSIRTTIKRCLEKDRKTRIPEISVVRFLMDDAATPAVPLIAPVVNPVRRSALGRGLPLAAAGALAVALAVVLAAWAPWKKLAPAAPLRLEVGLGGDASLATEPGAAVALSRDGAVLAFVGQSSAARETQVFVRRLDQLVATPLRGTGGATSPFFSPDGQWIAFFAGGKLKKVSSAGGAVVTLCDAPNSRGGTWADDGTIVFQPSTEPQTSLLRVTSAGGKPVALATLGEGEVTQRWPQALPGGKAVLYTGHTGTTGFEEASLVVQPLPGGAPKVVQRGAYYGRYLQSGHLVYIHDGTLFAAPFDLDRLQLAGEAVPVLEGVSAIARSGGAQFTISDNGTLVYLPGFAASVGVPIHWLDRTGKTTPLRATPSNWTNLRFAPDGRQLALDISDGKQTEVWLYDWAHDRLSRRTFGSTGSQEPVWTPDGQRIVFSSRRGDKAALNLYWQRADGTGEAQRLTNAKNSQRPTSWHPSGKFLAFEETTAQTASDVMILPMEGDEASGWKPGTPTVFLNSPFQELAPMFSPDGRWLAYVSTESGRDEVYVRPFPGPGGKWLISTGGGMIPVWSRTRHELFYATPDQRIMVASYTVSADSFRAEKPEFWSEGRFLELQRQGRPTSRSFDLHPDGLRFAIAPASESATARQDKVVFIFNFFDELRRIAPAGAH